MDDNYLPPEVLIKIFSYLSQVDLLTTVNTVCHYWNEVAFSKSLWKKIDVTYSTDRELDIYLQNIAHYQDFVQNLLIQSCHLMKFFDITKNWNLSNLRNLQIRYDEPTFNRYFYEYTVAFCPGIVSTLLKLSKSSDLRHTLSISSNLQLRDFHLYCMFARFVRSKEVINLIISGFFSNQCSLQSLSINCSVLESETTIKLLSSLKDLTCLDLSDSTGVDGCVFTALPELSKLTALDLSHTSVNDEDLKNIATKASHMKKLTLMNCPRLSDIGIEYIADGCHCLERFVIHSSDKITGIRLFPSTLESLGKGCQKLKHLALKDCTGLDDSGVIALVQNCHELEYLELHSKNISSPSLHAISHSCSNLFYLEIDGYNFNAASVESLLTKHRFIKYVSIRSCSNINAIDLCKSAETKSGILKTHSHVSKLWIYGQTDTVYTAIEQIVTFCPDLRQLALPPTKTVVRGDVIKIVFHKCRFMEALALGNSKIINRTYFKTNLK